MDTVVEFLEHPGTAKRRPPHHDSVDTVAFESLPRLFRRGDVAVPHDGYVHPRVTLDFPDERPVGLTGVHLRARPPVNRQCRYAAVLQLLGQRDDYLAVVVPSQSRLDSHRDGDGIDYGARDGQHTRDVLQQSRARTLARHALHGATEVQVEHVRAGPVDDQLCRVAHGCRVLAVDLDGHGAFFIADGQFFETAVDPAHQGVGCDKLRVDHGRTETAAEQAETDVRDILHGSEEERLLPQVDVSYLHAFRIVSFAHSVIPTAATTAETRVRSSRPDVPRGLSGWSSRA